MNKEKWDKLTWSEKRYYANLERRSRFKRKAKKMRKHALEVQNGAYFRDIQFIKPKNTHYIAKDDYKSIKSKDGKFLFYTKRNQITGLKRLEV